MSKVVTILNISFQSVDIFYLKKTITLYPRDTYSYLLEIETVL